VLGSLNFSGAQAASFGLVGGHFIGLGSMLGAHGKRMSAARKLDFAQVQL
jgi:hypothetical protein